MADDDGEGFKTGHVRRQSPQEPPTREGSYSQRPSHDPRPSGARRLLIAASLLVVLTLAIVALIMLVRGGQLCLWAVRCFLCLGVRTGCVLASRKSTTRFQTGPVRKR